MGDNFKPSLERGSAYGMDVFQVRLPLVYSVR